MKSVFWILITIFFSFGCKPRVPSGIIEQEKMGKILYDIHLVDGYISTIYVPDSARKVGAVYYNGVYKKYDTDSAQYAKSLKYYNSNPGIMQDMYKVIAKRLEKQKKGIQIADSLLLVKRFKADSVKIIKKFKADSLAIIKNMKKPDSLAKAKAKTEISKKKKVADSLIKTKKGGVLTLASPVAL